MATLAEDSPVSFRTGPVTLPWLKYAPGTLGTKNTICTNSRGYFSEPVIDFQGNSTKVRGETWEDLRKNSIAFCHLVLFNLHNDAFINEVFHIDYQKLKHQIGCFAL